MRNKIFTGLIALSLLSITGGMTFFGNIRDARADTNNDDGLVAYWNFNEETGNAYDSSGYNNHGVIHGAIRAVGVSGNALEFDGVDDYIEVGDIAMNDIPVLSIELWMKYRTNTGTGPYGGPGNVNTIIAKQTGSSHNRNFVVSLVNQTIWFGFADGVSQVCWIDSSILLPNVWYHVIATRDGSSANLYINGSLVNSTSYSFTPTTNVNPLLMGYGYMTNYPERYFDGIIDEIRIYNRALNSSEVELHYNSLSRTNVDIFPSTSVVQENESFTIRIDLNPREPIAGAQCDLYFNPALLTANSVMDGGYFDMWTDFNLEIDNINGVISNISAVDLSGEIAQGTFVYINFTAKSVEGTSFLNLSNIVIGRPDGTPVPLIFNNGNATVITYPPWDLNKDNRTNILDLILLVQHWGETGSPCWIPADVNCDGVINILDMVLVGQHWTG